MSTHLINVNDVVAPVESASQFPHLMPLTLHPLPEQVATGWSNGLSQDYDRKLGKWFADRPGARRQLTEMFQQEKEMNIPKRATSEELVAIMLATSANSASIGDVNSTAKGSGARYNAGKPDFSLIPLCTLEDEARVWMHGTKKYARNNWQKGMAWSVPVASLMRHLSAWQSGQDNDPESGLPHMAHIACNVRMLTLYAKTFPEGDDRPRYLVDAV